MAKNSLNTNKQFMIGNGILAFAVIAVVVIFIYMSMKVQNDKKNGKTYPEVYHIELASGFGGDSLSVYLNDSLLASTRIPEDSVLRLDVKRFAEESALLVVEHPGEKVSTFSLSSKGGPVGISKKDGIIYLSPSDGSN